MTGAPIGRRLVWWTSWNGRRRHSLAHTRLRPCQATLQADRKQRTPKMFTQTRDLSETASTFVSDSSQARKSMTIKVPLSRAKSLLVGAKVCSPSSLILFLVVVALTGSCATSPKRDNQQPANNEQPFASMINSAVINGKVGLACDISPASSDDSVALVLWYKDDSLAPIFTLDARKVNSLDRSKITVDDNYANRAAFELRGKPAHLQLEHIRPDDEGDYRCRVDFKRGRTVNTIIALKVVQPPSEIRITSGLMNSRAKLDGLIGPFDEGSELVLTCSVSGGKPRPQVIWRRDFNVIDESHQLVDKEETTNELRIPGLNKNHLLSIFTCQASNTNLTAPLQSSITLDLNLKPQEVTVRHLGSDLLVSGQSATFECVSHGSRPQATIHWLFQGERQDPPMSVDQQQTSSRITLTLERSFNQQLLTCVAENPKMPLSSSAIRQSLKLDVHYPPMLKIGLDSSLGSAGALPAAIQEGNDVYLACHVEANPRPIKPVLWRFNGRPLPASSTSGSTGQSHSLVLRKVTRHQAGSYTCEASNQYGANSSQPMDLAVRHAPVCSSDDVLVYEVAIGQRISLECGVQANPSSSVHFSWFKAGGHSTKPEVAQQLHNLSEWALRDIGGEDEQIDESSGRLKIRIQDETSLGLFKCKAKNAVGLQQRACLFQVRLVRAEPPKLVHSCQLASVEAPENFRSTGGLLGLKCSRRDRHQSGLSQSNYNNNNELAKHIPTGGSAKLRIGSEFLASNGVDLVAGNQQANSIPRLRLVYPPQLLLVEVHRLDSSGGGVVELADRFLVAPSELQLPAIRWTLEDDHMASNLFAGSQLDSRGTTHSVSQFRLLASQALNESSVSTPETGSRSNPQSQEVINFQLNFKSTRSPGAIQQQQQTDELVDLVDPSTQLADSFAFQVDHLELDAHYKLLIYAQNLLNKSRDWLVLDASTGSSGGHSRQLGSPSSASQTLGAQNDEPEVASQPNQPSSGGHQKSLVMRSESAELTKASRSANKPVVVNGMIQSGTSGGQEEPNLKLLFHRTSSVLLSQAEQRPLVAVPVALATILGTLALVVWMGSVLVQYIMAPIVGGVCGRRRRGSRDRHQRHSSQDPETEPSDVSGDLKKAPPSGRADGSSPGDSFNSTSYQSSNSMSAGSSEHHHHHHHLQLVNGCAEGANQQKDDFPSVLLMQSRGVTGYGSVGHQHQTVYTIDGSSLIELTEAAAMPLPMGPLTTGSLDRRSIYLAPGNDQPAQLLLGGGGGLNNTINGGSRRQARPAAGSCNYTGSFSSSGECTTHSNGGHQDQDIYQQNYQLLDENQGRRHQNIQQRNLNRRNQRVAFDLSNQTGSGLAMDAPAIGRGNKHHHHLQYATNKGSDSGMESPSQSYASTAQLMSAARSTQSGRKSTHNQQLNGMMPFDELNELGHDLQLMKDPSVTNIGQQHQQQQQQQQLMMFVSQPEMSPGSQETSSTTLLHSELLNSTTCSPNQEQQQQQKVCQIHQHDSLQMMSTSFAESQEQPTNRIDQCLSYL